MCRLMGTDPEARKGLSSAGLVVISRIPVGQPSCAHSHFTSTGGLIDSPIAVCYPQKGNCQVTADLPDGRSGPREKQGTGLQQGLYPFSITHPPQHLLKPGIVHCRLLSSSNNAHLRPTNLPWKLWGDRNNLRHPIARLLPPIVPLFLPLTATASKWMCARWCWC